MNEYDFEKNVLKLKNYTSVYTDKIPYYIIMPSLDGSITEGLFLNCTFFNRFDSYIVNSCNIRAMIAFLPSSFEELMKPWPLSSCNYTVSSGYQVIYIYEEHVPEIYDEISSNPLGCIFIMKNVSEKTIEEIIKHSSLPVVTEEGKKFRALTFEKSSIRKMFLIWEDNINKFLKNGGIDDKVTIMHINGNKSRLQGVYAPSIKFLDPLSTTIDRQRGLYASKMRNIYLVPASNPETQEQKEIEADKLIVDLLRKQICEKFLILHLGFITEGSFDLHDCELFESFGINKKDLDLVATGNNNELFQKLSSRLEDHFDRIHFTTDMIICMPSINKYIVDSLNKLLGKERIPKKILRLFYDNKTYYNSILSEDIFAHDKEKQDNNMMLILELIGEIAKEHAVLTTLPIHYSLTRYNPFIRTRNVPSALVDRTTDDMMKRVKYFTRNDIQILNNSFKIVSDHILNTMTTDFWNIIKNNGEHVKVISDIPVEWVKLSKAPINVEKSFSRIPILPGNSLISHSYLLREYVISKQNIEILLLNALDTNDELFTVAESLFKTLNNYMAVLDKKVFYKHIRKREDFFETIENHRPPILIFFGHGDFSLSEMVGKLYIGTESINSIDIETLKWKPIVTILGACNTQVVHSSGLNVASIFLAAGTPSVIGSHFPINGDHAMFFICGLIRNLILTIANVSPEHFTKWSDVVLMTLRSHYLLDPIFSLNYRLKKLGIKRSVPDNIIDKYFEFCSENKYSIGKIYEERESIFSTILQDDTLIHKEYNNMINNHQLFPQSQFYTSLGSPEIITIKREEISLSNKEIYKAMDISNI